MKYLASDGLVPLPNTNVPFRIQLQNQEPNKMNSMLGIKKLGIGLALAAGLAVGNQALASPVTISYSSTAGSDITFTGGGNFNFTPVSGSNFQLNDGSDDLGLITGAYKIGTISGNSAPVTDTTAGMISITDGSGVTLTADVSWVSITQNGASSALNEDGLANLTNISYSGSQADLIALAAGGNGSDVLNFTFNPSESLSKMAAGGLSTSFSGSLSSVPDSGATAMLIGLGVAALGIGLMTQRRKGSVLR
ncbi:MAG: hypothetical protein ACREFX_07565 [Opitutaceae bacterium]